jgi:hypothetical protein
MVNYSSYDDQTPVLFSKRARAAQVPKPPPSKPEPDIRNLGVIDLAKKLGLSSSQVQTLGQDGLDRLKNTAQRASMIAEGGQVLQREKAQRDADERSRGMDTPEIITALEKQTPGVSEARAIAEELGKTKDQQFQGLFKVYQQVREAVTSNDMTTMVGKMLEGARYAQAMDILWYPEIRAQAANREKLPGMPGGAAPGAAIAGTPAGGTPPVPGMPDTSLAGIQAAMAAKDPMDAGGLGPVQGTAGPFEKIWMAKTIGPTGVVPVGGFLNAGAENEQRQREGKLPTFFRADQTAQLGMGPDVAGQPTGGPLPPAGAGGPGGKYVDVTALLPPNAGPPGPLAGGQHVDQAALAAGATTFAGIGGDLRQYGPAAQGPPAPPANPLRSISQARQAFSGSPVGPGVPTGEPVAPTPASTPPPSTSPFPPSGIVGDVMKGAGAAGDALATSIADLAKTGMQHLNDLHSRASGVMQGAGGGQLPMPAAPRTEQPPAKSVQAPAGTPSRVDLATQLAQQWARDEITPDEIYKTLAQMFPELTGQL